MARDGTPTTGRLLNYDRTTASDLVFTGVREGCFVALNARTGVPLWKLSVGGVVASGPMTYSVGGRQYVAAAAGGSLFASPCTSSRLDSE